MSKLSIGAAFSETFAFLKANWAQMLIWLGGGLLVVGLLGYLLLGSTISAMAMAPEDPSVVMSAVGKIGLFSIIAAVVLYAASMLIWRGGLHPGEAPNFGWALQAGPAFAFGMMIVMIAAYILVIIVMMIFAMIFGVAGGFSPAALESGAVGGVAMAVMVLLYIGMLVFMLWVQARFSVAGPVMADRLTRNPITGLSESWKLTQASQWSIVGFYVLFTILIFVYALVAGMIFGGIFTSALAGGSAIGAIVSMIVAGAVIYLPILLLSFSVPAGLYRALAPRASGDVFA